MRKIGLILDSGSGLTIHEANQRGHGFIPLQISINGNVKRAGIELSLNELWNSMQDKKSVEVKTSLPGGSDIEAAFDWALERYEKAIYIGLTHKVSGTQNAVKTVQSLNDKYKERIYVYESEYGSPWLNLYLDQFEWLVDTFDDLSVIKRILDAAIPYCFALLGPEDIYWFYKGGRISKSTYLVGSLLKVVPILTWEDGWLDKDKVTKARGFAKASKKMVEILKGKTDSIEADGLPYKVIALNSFNKELNKDMVNDLMDAYELESDDIILANLSLEQTAHLGPGSLGNGVIVSLIDLAKKEGLLEKTEETKLEVSTEE